MDEELKIFISENSDIVYLFFREVKKDDRNLLSKYTNHLLILQEMMY